MFGGGGGVRLKSGLCKHIFTEQHLLLPWKKRHCLPARLLNFNIYFNIKHVEK